MAPDGAFNPKIPWKLAVLRRPPWRRIYAIDPSVSESKARIKTFNKGSLGSCIDEERSEARNVV